MTKVCTNSFVFKFVGGEPGQKRKCHYCQQEKTGGMICVYSNCECGGEGFTLFVCQLCANVGIAESEQQWADIAKRVNLVDLAKRDTQEGRSDGR